MLSTDADWHARDRGANEKREERGNPGARIFVGRQQELDALEAALAAARAGEPQVVVVQGDAGIGKSSLVLEFLGRQPGLPAVVASGEQDETVMPFGVVQQLSAEVAATASPAQDLELLSGGPGPSADPLAVGVEVRALIFALQHEQAVAVVVVEDLQWADLPSARALLFAVRRLGGDRVLVVFTGRPGAAAQLGEGWVRFVGGDRRASVLTLGGLDAGELGQLCGRLGRTGLSDRAVGRLADHTGGNPLLARALLEELSDEELKAQGEFLRAPRSLASLILPRLAALSRSARELVIAAAVLGDRAALADAAQLAGTAKPVAALEKAERAGLLSGRDTPSGRMVAFPHLLMRRAIYCDLGAEQRRQLHLRAAAITSGQQALAHRVAGADGQDMALADELCAAAAAAAAAGDPLLSARYLQQSAAVTEPGPERDERVLSAFELLVRASDLAAASVIAPLIEQLPAGARRDTALGQFALLAARPDDAEALLRSAWDAHDRDRERDTGGEAALGLGMLRKMSGAHAEAALWLDRALGSGTGDEPWYDAARCIRSFTFVVDGAVGRALAILGDLPARPELVPAARTDALAFRGMARLWTADLPGAVGDLGLAVDRIRAGVQLRFPGRALAFLAEAEFRLGRWDDARDHAGLAVSLACDADQAYDLVVVHSAAVPVAACRGDWDAADEHAQAAERAAHTFGGFAAVLAASARGILGLARDDPEEVLHGTAVALGAPQVDRFDSAGFWWRPAQAWALIRTGHLSSAERILAIMESRAARRGEPAAQAQTAWLRGSLAMAHGDLDQADRVLGAARRAAVIRSLPFHRGLLGLQHGRCLSLLERGTAQAAADAMLSARDAFGALGAAPFLRASQTELARTGVPPQARRSGGPRFTAQELRVARLVASGLSNREVAAQLFLSPKTVEYHLANAFTKLGVRSRHQLGSWIRDWET